MNRIRYYRETAASCQTACRQYLSGAPLRQMLEDYRGLQDPGQIEVLLCVLDAHLPEVTEESRDSILAFLYDCLSHADGDVRRQAAALAGKVLAGCDPALWRNFLRKILFSSVLMPQQQRRWIGFALKYILQSLLSHAGQKSQKQVPACDVSSGTDADVKAYLRIFTEYYKSTGWDDLTCFFLLDCAPAVPYGLCNDSQRKMLLGFARYFLVSPNRELSCAALIFTDYWLEEGAGSGLNMDPYIDLFSKIGKEDPSPGMRMLSQQVLHPDTPVDFTQHPGLFVQLLLENRSLEIPWIIKQVNLRILRRLRRTIPEDGDRAALLTQYASGLLHMLQYSGHIVNRLQARDDLNSLVRDLDIDARRLVVTELIRAIETGDKNVLRYVPDSLGYVYTTLPGEDRAEPKMRLLSMMDSRSESILTAAMETAAAVLSFTPEEADDFLGMLCCGLAHYNTRIGQYALFLIGTRLYGGTENPANTLIYHAFLAEKLPCFMPKAADRSGVLCRAASFGKIADYLDRHSEEVLALPEIQNVAFFPGSFDPFTRGNRAVVREIAQMGFSVYLCADEFSWSRHMQPLRIRQKIIALSVADLKNTYMFPEDVQINIARPEDLKTLTDMFPGKKVYLVAGSDVIENASAYRMKPVPGSVHSFPHIVFSRNTELISGEADKIHGILPADSIWLKLPSFYEQISTADVRERVFHGRDISDLVLKRVRNYIYEQNLYASATMQSLKKPAPMVRPVQVLEGSEPAGGVQTLEVWTARDLCESVAAQEHFRADASAAQEQFKVDASAAQEHFRVDASAAQKHFRPDASALQNTERDISENSLVGRVCYTLDGTSAHILSLENIRGDHNDGAAIVMQELLMQCKTKGLTRVSFPAGEKWAELTSMFGFVPAKGGEGLYEVSLEQPIILFSDTGYSIRAPYAGMPSVRAALHGAQMRLLSAAAALLPGHAILRAEAEALSFRLLKLITDTLETQTGAPIGAPAMQTVVPVGKLFKKTVIPGAVTKDLYIEKEYSEDLASSRITNSPDTAPLSSQARMIRSLMRPVILVDDIYSLDQNGAAVCSLFTEQAVPVSSFIVGIHSGSGSLSEDEGSVNLKAVYTIPDAALILTESELYPFIGGTSVCSDDLHYGIPSINPVLPYQFPHLSAQVDENAFRQFSAVCMENTLEICHALENEYLQKNGRRLTLPRLREVFAEERIPDSLLDGFPPENRTPSELLAADVKRLGRLIS